MFFVRIASITYIWKIVKNTCIFIIEWELIILNNKPFSLRFLIDEYALMFAFSVRVISSSIFIFSHSYIKSEKFFLRFHVLVFLFVISILILIFRANFILLILGWDGLGVTSYLLVVYFQSSKSWNAGFLTALTNRIGDAIILISIGLFWSMSWNFWRWSFIVTLSWNKSLLLMILLIIGAFTKRAQIPFSAWLPAAIAAPTPVSALVHSSTLVTAGVYILFRFQPILKRNLYGSYSFFILFFGRLTIIIAGLSALKERDIKKIIALSTLSQLGVMMTTIGIGYYQLCFFHLLSHAYFKALLFIRIGRIIHITRDYQDLRKASLNLKTSPIALTRCFCANLSLCGIPFSRGFYSKDMCIEYFFYSSRNLILGMVFLIATFLTVAYSFRLLSVIYYSTRRIKRLSWSRDIDKNIFFSITGLLGIRLIGALFISWSLFFSPLKDNFSFLEKSLILTLIALGAFAGIFMYNKELKKSSVINFTNYMWALPFISTRLISKINFVLADFFKINLDMKWTHFVLSPFERYRVNFKTWRVSHEYHLKFFAGILGSFLFYIIISL